MTVDGGVVTGVLAVDFVDEVVVFIAVVVTAVAANVDFVDAFVVVVTVVVAAIAANVAFVYFAVVVVVDAVLGFAVVYTVDGVAFVDVAAVVVDL